MELPTLRQVGIEEQEILGSALWMKAYIDVLVQDCSNSSALAMELLQSCTKPPNCHGETV